jgi:hypothetical protein
MKTVVAANVVSSARDNTEGVVYCPPMAAKETTLKEIGEMLTHVVEHMATKEDISGLNNRVDRMETRWRSLRT